MQVLRAGMEGLDSVTQMYPKTTRLDIEVMAMGVVSPEGQLIRTGGLLHPSKSNAALTGQPCQLRIVCLTDLRGCNFLRGHSGLLEDTANVLSEVSVGGR
jgi:hypothetical protein